MDLRTQLTLAKEASRVLATLSRGEKDKALHSMAQSLRERVAEILQANAEDMEAAQAAGISGALLDRLRLTPGRIEGMAQGLEEVASLRDPVGSEISMELRPNGLEIRKVRVPMGVVGIIYEARPNVTADAAGLCLKAGNAVVLRGGSEAFLSNQSITQALRQGLSQTSIPVEALQLIQTTDRGAVQELIRMRGLLDLVIPRGGAGLIQAVVENSTVPVIETGVGNCHTYIAEAACVEKAVAIAVNAKCHRPGVCNAMETLLVHKQMAGRVLPLLAEALQREGVEIRGCAQTQEWIPQATAATEEDWATEYLDLILAVRVVDSLDEAIAHITRYGTGHSEAILTEDLGEARRFLKEVDAAAVFVNASTRFTDGQQFGLGAEIGISTQKLHARGPMGLEALTSVKFQIMGEGQIRE